MVTHADRESVRQESGNRLLGPRDIIFINSRQSKAGFLIWWKGHKQLIKNEHTHETQSSPVPERPRFHEFPGCCGAGDKCHDALFRMRRPVLGVCTAVTAGAVT